MDMSEMRACRILNIWNRTQLFPEYKSLISIDKMKASFKNERKSLKGEAAKQQLLYISYERQWQSQIRALTGAPRL